MKFKPCLDIVELKYTTLTPPNFRKYLSGFRRYIPYGMIKKKCTQLFLLLHTYIGTNAICT